MRVVNLLPHTISLVAQDGAHARAPANATVCFDYSDPDDPDTGTCLTSAVVGVARCEAGFLLWRLPYAPDCSAGYGTVLMVNQGVR